MRVAVVVCQRVQAKMSLDGGGAVGYAGVPGVKGAGTTGSAIAAEYMPRVEPVGIGACWPTLVAAVGEGRKSPCRP